LLKKLGLLTVRINSVLISTYHVFNILQVTEKSKFLHEPPHLDYLDYNGVQQYKVRRFAQRFWLSYFD
jgi:hypothetical protein